MATQKQGTIGGLAKKAECSCGCGDTVANCKCGPSCSCRKPGGSCYKAESEKAGRCWSGYEPVPGSKPYTDGSCRPAGSKKTQKDMKKQANLAALLAKLGPRLAGGLDNMGTSLAGAASKARPSIERGLNRYGQLLSGSKANALQSHVDELSKLLRGRDDRIKGISATFANARPRVEGPTGRIVGLRSNTLHPNTDVQTLMDDRPNALINQYLLNPAKKELSDEQGLSALTRLGTGLGGAELLSRNLTGKSLPSMNEAVGIPSAKWTDKEGAAIASLTPLERLTFRKQARDRVVVHVANMLKLAMEMERYNVVGLQKAAALGIAEQQRLKYAALAVRFQQEKQAAVALMSLLSRASKATGLPAAMAAGDVAGS